MTRCNSLVCAGYKFRLICCLLQRPPTPLFLFYTPSQRMQFAGRTDGICLTIFMWPTLLLILLRCEVEKRTCKPCRVIQRNFFEWYMNQTYSHGHKITFISLVPLSKVLCWAYIVPQASPAKIHGT